MLGRKLHDPEALEGPAGTVDGLGLLDVETVLQSGKTLTRVSGTHCASATAIDGYEIHLGRTEGADCSRPFAMIAGVADGATDPAGQVTGTYVHGCFASDEFRRAFLTSLGAAASSLRFDDLVEQTLDELARHLEANLDLDRIMDLAGPV
jgi:adenosylcobyric acid synthase